MNLMDMLTGGSDPNKPSLLGFINRLPGILSPGSEGPVAAAGQSELDPAMQDALKAQYSRSYGGAQAAAVAKGLPQWGVAPMAADAAQSDYNSSVQNALKMAEQVKAARKDDERHARIQKLIGPDSPYNPQQQAALGAMSDDQAGETLGKAAFEVQPVALGSGTYLLPKADGSGWEYHAGEDDKMPKAKILDDGSAVVPQSDGTFKYFKPPMLLGSAATTGQRIAGAQAAALVKSNTAMDPAYIYKVSKYQADLPSPRSANYGSVIAAATRLNGAFDASKYAEHKKAMADFGTGKQGDKVVALNNTIEHLDTLGDLANDLGNGSFTPGNFADQEYNRVFGEPAPTSFEGIKHIVSAEIATAIIPGQSAENDREHFAEAAALSKSPKQLADIINKVQRLMATRAGGLGAQYERTTGYKDFKQVFLSPRTRQVLDSFPDSAAAKPGTPSPGFGVAH